MPIFYLRGNFGNNSWNFQDSFKFTRSGNVYSLTINSFNSLGNCEFKISNDDWTINYGADETVTTSRYVDGVFDGPNMKTPGLTNAVISFTYNEDSPVKTSIKFVVDGVEPEPGLEPDPEPEAVPGTYPDVFLRGNFNNTGWAANNNYKFSRTGDVYTLNVERFAPLLVSVMVWELSIVMFCCWPPRSTISQLASPILKLLPASIGLEAVMLRV